MDETNVCKATKRDGTPCSAPARFGEYCFWHSPLAAELRHQGAIAGGKATGAVKHLQALKPLKRPRQMLERIEELYAYLISGEISPKLATAAVKLLAEAREAYALCVLEQRLERALEALELQEIQGTVIVHDDETPRETGHESGTTDGQTEEEGHDLQGSPGTDDHSIR